MTPRTSAIGYALILVLGIAAGIVLSGCNLSHVGRTAVATRIAVDAVDKGCETFLAHENETLPAYVAESVRTCNPAPDPVACFNGRTSAREGAIKACRVYGEGRASAAARDAARAALSAIGAQ